MNAKLVTPGIVRPREFATLNGVRYPFPSDAQIDQANRLTARQLELHDEFAAIKGKTDQAEGRKTQIMRIVGALERSKHRLLQMDVLHLLPAYLRHKVNEPFR